MNRLRLILLAGIVVVPFSAPAPVFGGYRGGFVYGTRAGAFGVNSFGVSPFGLNTFGVNTFGVSPFGLNNFGVNNFGVSPFGLNNFGVSPFGVNNLGVSPFGLNTFGVNNFGVSPFGLNTFGVVPSGIGTFGLTTSSMSPLTTSSYTVQRFTTGAPVETFFTGTGGTIMDRLTTLEGKVAALETTVKGLKPATGPADPIVQDPLTSSTRGVTSPIKTMPRAAAPESVSAEQERLKQQVRELNEQMQALMSDPTKPLTPENQKKFGELMKKMKELGEK